jgi:nucleotide-binding universal stress UspA family protein
LQTGGADTLVDFNNILIANDFSKSAEHAILYGVYLGKRLGGRLHNVHVNVLHPDLSDRPEEYRTTDADDLLERLKEVQRGNLPSGQAFAPWGLDIVHEVKRDVAAAPAILEYADEQDIDLIVMGTHGRRGVRRLLVGSVAAEVVRRARCPVLITGPEPVPSGTNRILAPIDFSAHSEKAVRHSRDLAELFGAKLDLLHVVEENMPTAFYTAGVTSVYDMHPDIEDKAKDEMQKLFEGMEGPEVEANYFAVPGRPASAILNFARENDSDMIVMATHGRSGLEHVFLGSVAERVVQRAPCPVFTVRTLHPGTGETSAEDAAEAEAP